MSKPLATYSFLPWLRQGIANNISQADADPTVKRRASVPIRIFIAGKKTDDSVLPTEQVDQEIELYGPGDIVGIDKKAIIKTEPQNWISNFEPNYLPYIDFYEEDFPWRYTPAKAQNERLRPWLSLVVLQTAEFEDGPHIKDKPLPHFKLKENVDASHIFPKADQLWAWAHVHVNTDLSNGSAPAAADAGQINQEITRIIKQDPDLAYSRIVCPRKLQANASYHAFLIPTFETGRLAGLGLPIDANLTATAGSWDNDANRAFPYYHRWSFQTGTVGDFEYLVNLLKPKLADKSVGVRDIDVLHIGSNLPAIADTELNGILKLGGALRVPTDTLKDEDKAIVRLYDEWDEHPYPHKFTKAMAARINLGDEYSHSTKAIQEINKEAGIVLENNEGDPDPVITSPLYGRWHTLQERLLEDRNNTSLPHSKNWIHELNLDPRFRVAAGFGTKVLQKNQEEYMHAAWEQVGEIVEANSKLQFAQMAQAVSDRIYQQKLLPQLLHKSFVFTAPVHRRIVHQELTIKATVSDSIIPSTLLSGAFRSATRPRGPLMKKLTFTSQINPFNLIERVNNGQVEAVRPKEDPQGAINLNDVIKETYPQKAPPAIIALLRKYKWFKYLPLILLLLLLLFLSLFFSGSTSSSWFGGIAAVCIMLYLYFIKIEKELDDVYSASQEEQVPEAVASYAPSPNFKITEEGSAFAPARGTTDSAEGERFKSALADVFNLVSITFSEPKREKLDLAQLNTTIIQKLNPLLTIPKRTLNRIKLPRHIRDNMVETFAPVLVYPEIDIPMYKPLADLSSELFLPNLNKIEQNSITLLENNQKFIESYMVGINHEMSRELLWREYPTDQRGTYFRQFWDVSSFLASPSPSDDLKEKLRDIPPIHKWAKTNTSKLIPSDLNSIKKNDLGSHNNRALASGKTQLVLVIRGELLKKYPTAVIYAQKAAWGKKNEVADIHAERVLFDLAEYEDETPPSNLLKTPLFEAKIEPDIYFFGFDLDDEEARGTKDPVHTSDDPGWFFVLKERPGEPRFGLDIEKSERIINWNNLSWKDIGTADNSCITLSTTIAFKNYDSNIDQENTANADDAQARWGASSTSAELAYILYQVPVMVAIHASKMLPK